MPLPTISINPAAEQAASAIRAALVNGEYPPGMRLFEGAIAGELGISRMPVREALAALLGQGLLERRNRCVRVPNLDAAEIEEVYIARSALESVLYERAASRLNELDVAELERIEALVEGASTEGALVDLAAHNRTFHFAVMEKADLPRVLDLIGQLWDRTSYYRAFFWVDDEHRTITMNQHCEIIEACRNRDARGLVSLHDQHRLQMFNAQMRWLAHREPLSGEKGLDAVVEPPPG
jgi:DNA-binding GntR family transcriptional regulator